MMRPQWNSNQNFSKCNYFPFLQFANGQSTFFSDIEEGSAINSINPRDRKGSYKVWFWWKYSDRMHAKSKEIVQPNAVYKTGAIKSWVQKPY